LFACFLPRNVHYHVNEGAALGEKLGRRLGEGDTRTNVQVIAGDAFFVFDKMRENRGSAATHSFAGGC